MTDKKVPTLVPVSSAEASKFRKLKIMNNPVTLGTIVSGTGLFMVLSGWYGLSFTAIWAILSEILVGIGVSNLFLDIFIRKSYHELQYLKKHEYNRELNVKNRSYYLISEFRDLKLEHLAELVNKTNHFFSNYKDILEDKFFEDSLTHAEYLSPGEQITIAILNKLLDISTKYKSVLPIDEDYINKNLSNADDSKKSTLENRLNLKKKQENDVNQMILEIEEALTQLAELTVKVANISDSNKAQALENLKVQITMLANNTNLLLPEKGL